MCTGSRACTFRECFSSVFDDFSYGFFFANVYVCIHTREACVFPETKEHSIEHVKYHNLEKNVIYIYIYSRMFFPILKKSSMLTGINFETLENLSTVIIHPSTPSSHR